jgi:hypothetical protein
MIGTRALHDPSGGREETHDLAHLRASILHARRTETAAAFATFVAVCALATASRSGADPAAAPVYGYTYTPPAATGSPRILKIELNSTHLHAGGQFDIRVTTTTDVTRVVTGNGKHQGTLTAAGNGVFTGDSTLPHVGGLLSVGIKIHVEASTADGKSTSADVPVHYK